MAEGVFMGEISCYSQICIHLSGKLGNMCGMVGKFDYITLRCLPIFKMWAWKELSIICLFKGNV